MFLAICILAGTLGNACVYIFLRRRQDLRKVAHYLLGNLAAIGVFSALFSTPLLIVMTTVNYFQIEDSEVAEILCKVGFPSGYACIVVNALTLWLMAFDRHDCVRRPFRRRLTTRNVKKVVAGTWILAFMSAVFFAVSIRNEPSVCTKFYIYNNKITSHPYGVAFTVVFSVLYQLDKVTFVVVLITFFRIMRAFRSSAVRPSNSSQERRERRLTWLTFKLCCIFLLFRTPATISNALRGGNFDNTMLRTARLVTVAMVNFMYVANPVLHRKILAVRAPNQVGSSSRQMVQVAVPGTRVNENVRDEP